ncbi:serine/arginine-rich splicing factor SR45-like isoform X2 [Canna indica]|uniref:Serine/arginine-rich splicing factor SR45-like isoform X2 n=1 Tax=Canna indica TaxID=4628 RepID=A0AAQ3QA78_9LILI|nr:serine/arginine-rich splicing factor SR45-like isoform X2 [Canna indica]
MLILKQVVIKLTNTFFRALVVPTDRCFHGETRQRPADEPVGVAVPLVVSLSFLHRLRFPVAIPLSIPFQVILVLLLTLPKRELPQPFASAAEEVVIEVDEVPQEEIWLAPEERGNFVQNMCSKGRDPKLETSDRSSGKQGFLEKWVQRKKKKSMLLASCKLDHPPRAGRRACSPTSPPKKASSPRKASPVPESVVLHIDHLSRNINEAHLKEIFGNFGEVVNVELAMDRLVNLPRGYGYVEFKKKVDAEKALLYMDGGQIDGCVVRVRFTLTQRQKASSPPKAIPVAPKREAPPRNKVGPSLEKDAPQRPRESSPWPKPLSPPLRRSPPPSRRADSPRRRLDSSPRRRLESPVRRRVDPSPHRRGETPPRRRPASPRRRSPSPRRHRSPPRRLSPRRGRGSPVRKRSPIPPRRRSPPRRPRSPPRRSPPPRRRSRSPLRRPLRSRSRSISPRRIRPPPPPPRRESSDSSYSGSPSPRKGSRRISRTRSPRRPGRGRSSSNSRSSSSPPPKG